MKLKYRIIKRVCIALLAILSIWAGVFYFVIIGEVYDEIDDNLKEYSESIISRFNSGEDLPNRNNGTNNSYHVELISDSYIDIDQSSLFLEDMVYIEAKGETEPARIFKTIFRSDSGKTYRLIVYTPSIEHEDLLESILLSVVSLFFLLLIVIIVINIWVYKSSMSPMYKILQWLKEYQLGGASGRLDNETDISEFQKLNDAINTNIERIEKNYITQKEFIANASHELQTPLAICKIRLDALLDSPLGEKQLGEIVKTQQTIDYMTRLNKTLLLLSKIENNQFVEKEMVDFSSMLESLISDFKEIYQSQHIDVQVESNAMLSVNMNHTLAKTLAINILKNAFVHNVNNGSVNVKIDSHSLTIENSGSKELDPSSIFERFYQGAKKENSTGLGLAIVHSICSENNFDVRYKFVEDKHQFSVIFE